MRASPTRGRGSRSRRKRARPSESSTANGRMVRWPRRWQAWASSNSGRRIDPMLQEAAAAGGLTQTLTNLAEPWSKLYSHSKTVSATVSFFHLAPLIFGAGAAFITDRATLRAARMDTGERTRHLIELGRIHGVVLFGLAVSFVSGILMFLSDVETFIGSKF